MLIVKSYSENEYGVFISLDIVKVAEYLAFKSERSAYNFLNNLEKLGFLTKNKNGFTVYYKSRKVINLEEVKETKRVTKEELENLIEERKVANGIQLKFNFEKLEAGTNIKEEKGKIYIFSRTQDIKRRRGSPPWDNKIITNISKIYTDWWKKSRFKTVIKLVKSRLKLIYFF